MVKGKYTARFNVSQKFTDYDEIISGTKIEGFLKPLISSSENTKIRIKI